MDWSLREGCDFPIHCATCALYPAILVTIRTLIPNARTLVPIIRAVVAAVPNVRAVSEYSYCYSEYPTPSPGCLLPYSDYPYRYSSLDAYSDYPYYDGSG